MAEHTVNAALPPGPAAGELPQNHRRQVFIILALVFILALIALGTLYFGRQHRIILENRPAAFGGGAARPAAPALLAAVNPAEPAEESPANPAERPFLELSVNLWPDKDESIRASLELQPRERLLIKVVGAAFDLELRPVNGREADDLKKLRVTLGFTRDALVNLAQAAAGRDDYLGPFPGQGQAQSGFSGGGRPGAIDLGDEDEDDGAFRRPGAIDLGDEDEDDGAFRRPGAIDLE